MTTDKDRLIFLQCLENFWVDNRDWYWFAEEQYKEIKKTEQKYKDTTEAILKWLSDFVDISEPNLGIWRKDWVEEYMINFLEYVKKEKDFNL